MMNDKKLEIIVAAVCSLVIDIYIVLSIVYTILNPVVGLWRVPILAGVFVPFNTYMVKTFVTEWFK